MKQAIRRSLCMLLTVFALPAGTAHMVHADAAWQNSGSLSAPENVKMWEFMRYSVYKSQHPAAGGAQSVRLTAADIVESGAAQLLSGYEGWPETAVSTGEDGFVTYRFTIASAGLYHIKAACFLPEGTGPSAVRGLEIDGAYPFREAAELTFYQLYGYENGRYFKELPDGTQVKSPRVEKPRWQTVLLRDPTGLDSEALLFYLEPGEHTLTFRGVESAMVIGAVEIAPPVSLPSYAVYRKREEDRHGTLSGEAKTITLQAEAMGERNSPALFGVSDGSSPDAVPYSYDQSLINMVSGASFKTPGQALSYSFEVKSAGWYRIAFKYRQAYRSGGYVSRRLYLDGAVPFEEANAFRFQYASGWQSVLFGGSSEAYALYLSPGTHTLTLEATLGDMSALASRCQTVIDTLNEVYRRLFAITGPTPDPFRDYHFESIAAGELRQLEEAGREIDGLIEEVVSLTGQRGSFLSAPEQLNVILKNMIKSPGSIATRLNAFVTNVGSLSEWMMSLQEQPLDLDLIEILPSGEQPLQAGGGFWESLLHQIRLFLRSFAGDYRAYGGETGAPALKVWLGSTGRDQAYIVKELVEEGFTPTYGVPVQIQFITGALLPSTLAGIGPDVFMFAPSTDPINYALRGAVEALDGFEGFDGVAARFSEQSMTPYTYKGKVYALPETEQFPMLFYRMDILNELEIPEPDTWDDIYNALSKLQSRHMTFGMLYDYTGYLMLLSQNGMPIYRENGRVINFDNVQGAAAFARWTDFFISYKLSTSYSFINRFRTGEMAMGLADFTTANQLYVSAPEIQGLWRMAPLPGVETENGEVNRLAPITSKANIMMKQSANKEAAWEFLRWWSSAGVQSAYAEQLEQGMGIAARYPTANLEAFAGQNWQREDAQALKKQRESLVGIPEVPGSYIVSRYIGFAFSAVIDEGMDPGKALLDYSEKINAELARKQKEFEKREH